MQVKIQHTLLYSQQTTAQHRIPKNSSAHGTTRKAFGPPSGQGAASGARTRARRLPADLGADSHETQETLNRDQ
ncbi:hypothetical protein PoB_004812300 [Plakobranchus ocellatus]|uniref:Uncharacterized protein n=1 Tax=Plakobranchus ocellatus TaxID=259542 RepID=A0AAV4BR63_9GAST|nr:hypothetical protein PoB_004812300 [Plakobranchus ocellatus]